MYSQSNDGRLITTTPILCARPVVLPQLNLCVLSELRNAVDFLIRNYGLLIRNYGLLIRNYELAT